MSGRSTSRSPAHHSSSPAPIVMPLGAAVAALKPTIGVTVTTSASRDQPVRSHRVVRLAAQPRSRASPMPQTARMAKSAAFPSEGRGHGAGHGVPERVVGAGGGGDGAAPVRRAADRHAVVGPAVPVGQAGALGRLDQVVGDAHQDSAPVLRLLPAEQLSVHQRAGPERVVDLVGPAEGGQGEGPGQLEQQRGGRHHPEGACGAAHRTVPTMVPSGSSTSVRSCCSGESSRSGERRASSRTSTVIRESRSCTRWYSETVVNRKTITIT